MTKRSLSILLGTMTLLIGSATPADAQQHVRTQDAVRLEAHGTLSTHEGIGAGIRGEFAVAPQGVLPDFNDDISLTFGADAILFFDGDHDHGPRDHEHDDEGLGVWIAGAVQWNFYFANKWSVFPEIGLWLQLGEDGHGHDRDRIDIDLLVGIGGRYHMSARSAILVRIEFPGILHVGVQF